MVPYSPKTSAAVERFFAERGYTNRNDLIVPCRVGLPVAMGLAGEAFERETGKFFDEAPLDPDSDAELIAELTAA